MNVVVEVRGGRVVEIYTESCDMSFTIVDWDEPAPGSSDPPDAYSFPAVEFSSLPAETLAAYRKAREDVSDACLLTTITRRVSG